jgi:hypothetical protein
MTYGDRTATTPDEQLPIPYKSQSKRGFDPESIKKDMNEFLLDNTTSTPSRILYLSKRGKDA